MKTPDLSPFIGSGFDMEFYDPTKAIGDGVLRGYDSKQIGAKIILLDDIRVIDGVTYYNGNRGLCRPRLDRWHFNDGSTVLPNGFVVEVIDWLRVKSKHVVKDGYIGDLPLKSMPNIMALRIIGVTEEYRRWGESVGMEVVGI